MSKGLSLVENVTDEGAVQEGTSTLRHFHLLSNLICKRIRPKVMLDRYVVDITLSVYRRGES